MTTIGVFAAVYDPEGKALCVRHGYGERAWGMPGGRLESGEDPVSAVKREILEETGVVADITGFVGVYSAIYRDDIVLLFVGAVRECTPWAANEEISEMGFYSVDHLPHPMSANSQLRFKDVAAGVRGAVRTLSQPGEVLEELNIPHAVAPS